MPCCHSGDLCLTDTGARRGSEDVKRLLQHDAAHTVTTRHPPVSDGH